MQARLLALCAAGALLAGCGGGGGGGDTPPAQGDVPASATASPAAYARFAAALPASETAEPLDLTGVVPPVSDTDEPIDVD